MKGGGIVLGRLCGLCSPLLAFKGVVQMMELGNFEELRTGAVHFDIYWEVNV